MKRNVTLRSIFLGLFFSLLLTMGPIAAQEDRIVWTWSDSIQPGDSYVWEVDVYKIDGETVDSDQGTNYPFHEGSVLRINVSEDPTSVNLNNATESISQIFTTEIDNLEVDDLGINLFTMIYPVIYENVNGTSLNILEQVAETDLAAPYYFEARGEELEDEKLTGEDEQMEIINGNLEYQIRNNQVDETFSLEITWEVNTGILQEYSLLDGNLSLLITKGVDSELIDVQEILFPSIFSIIPLMAIPVLKKLRN